MVIRLMMVIEKPRQFTMVRAVPFDSGGAECAIRVENCGESAITAIDQKNIVARKNSNGRAKRMGENRQQSSDRVRAVRAVLKLPQRFDAKPPATQAREPEPMIRNEVAGISRCTSGWPCW